MTAMTLNHLVQVRILVRQLPKPQAKERSFVGGVGATRGSCRVCTPPPPCRSRDRSLRSPGVTHRELEPKTDRNQLYAASLASNVLATAKEAFAVAPGINSVAIMVMRKDPPSQNGRLALSCLYCGRCKRERFQQLDWPQVDPLTEISTVPDALIERKGRTAEVVPLDLSDAPSLAGMLQSVAKALGCEANTKNSKRR